MSANALRNLLAEAAACFEERADALRGSKDEKYWRDLTAEAVAVRAVHETPAVCERGPWEAGCGYCGGCT